MKYDAKAFRIFNIDMASLPKTLYRYMPEWPYALGTLTTRYFHFSLISEFNDPFEGKFTEEECREDETWSKIVRINQDPQMIQLKESVEKETGVLCFSESNDNILMWSHYANSHKGIVIGLDPQFLCKQITSSDFDSLLQSVQYDENYPRVGYLNEFNLVKQTKMIVDKWYFTKFRQWEYEKEWRAIYKPGLTQFPKEIIRSIYFGAKFNSEKRDAWIKQIIESGIKPEMYQASLDKTAYKINFESINV